MGSTTSTTDKTLEIVVEEGDTTTYNGSIFTGYQTTPLMIEDYPFIIWEAGNKLGETY